ncbi:MAG: hypothetical protein U0791_24365 [Gemmataceae bacterium]
MMDANLEALRLAQRALRQAEVAVKEALALVEGLLPEEDTTLSPLQKAMQERGRRLVAILDARARRKWEERRALAALGLPTRPRHRGPEWDAEERTLSHNGVVLRRWSRSAPKQFAILDAFEAAGWPARVAIEGECSSSLGDTVMHLNENLAGVIQFGRDGSGTGVSWRYVEAQESESSPTPNLCGDAAVAG